MAQVRSVYVAAGVLLLVVIVAAAVLPGLLASGRASNDRRAEALLKVLSSADSDFKSNDRDWNHVNDFWTGDVKGLYTMTSSAIPGHDDPVQDPSIKLIMPEMAAADLDPDLVPAGGENRPLDAGMARAPYRGYWIAAMVKDRSAADPSYKKDTGGTPEMGECHHLTRFGFVAIPTTTAESKHVLLVNEQWTVYRARGPSHPRPDGSKPPDLKGVDPALLEWPTAEVLKSHWTVWE